MTIIISAILATTIASVVLHRYWMARRGFTTFLPSRVVFRLNERHAGSVGCTEKGYLHQREKRHGLCYHCGNRTCCRAGYTNRDTLKRSVGYVCAACDLLPESARGARRADDWNRMDPASTERLTFASLPEQYPSATRTALRAFAESGAALAIVDDIDPGTLNVSIKTLALDHLVYAETRGGETVLRRVGVPA